MSQASKNQSRILDVCLLMESDLTYPYTVESLAQYAGLSRFHFARSFKKVVGESAMAHLRRLRLARAAIVLKSSSASITQIAVNSGFDTHAGFTHAFTKAYGMSPVEFRDNYLVRAYMPLQAEGPLHADAAALAACRLSVGIEKSQTKRIALMRYVGPTAKMATIWTKMIEWCQRRDLLNDQSILMGIHHDDWDKDDPSGYAKYRYDAAIVVDAGFVPDDEIACNFYPGGEIATVRFAGSLNEFDKTWRTFTYDWLPASGYEPRCGTVYDIYPPSLFAGNQLSQIIKAYTGIEATLCIPISRKSSALAIPD